MAASLDPRITDALALLPDYLGQHVILSISAVTLGIVLGLPLAMASLSAPRWRFVLLSVVGLVQTIPSLALLALFYPLLLGLSLLTSAAFGVQFSALGFLPSVIALTLYSMLPIIRNTVTGIMGVDPAVKQAAMGVGMTPMQSLVRVEFPLALPTIMAGIRTASVWVIGTATLSTPVGQTSLGNYIFTGLQTQNWIFVLFGCVAAAVLALVVDALLGAVETALTRRDRRRLAASAVVLLCVVAAGSFPYFTAAGTQYVIGSKPFAEQYILASLLQQRLSAAHLSGVQRAGLGSTVAFDALKGGDVDAYVDYSGTIWTNYMHRTDYPSRDAILSEIDAWLQMQHVKLLGKLGFENAYALAMRRDKAEALGVKTIADLARQSATLSIAGDLEFFSRPEWKALQRDYGLSFRDQRVLQGTFMYRAVADGEVDVISAYSSDGEVAQYDLITLDDPQQSLPPYDAMLLISPKRAGDGALLAALSPLIGTISIERMRKANMLLAAGQGQQSPAAAARALWNDIAPEP